MARSGDLLAAARHYMTPAGLRVSLGANGPETRSYLGSARGLIPATQKG